MTNKIRDPPRPVPGSAGSRRDLPQRFGGEDPDRFVRVFKGDGESWHGGRADLHQRAGGAQLAISGAVFEDGGESWHGLRAGWPDGPQRSGGKPPDSFIRVFEGGD